MNKVFEDEFMDFQTALIALCLDVTEKKMSIKFMHIVLMKKRSKMFNAFFDVDGEVKTLNQLGISNKLAFQFLKLGTQDLEKVDAICTKYNMPIPTEMKLYYDVIAGKYDAKYKYEEVCSAKTGKNAGEVFSEWVSEIKG